jgi:hypothetical protein
MVDALQEAFVCVQEAMFTLVCRRCCFDFKLETRWIYQRFPSRYA